MVIKIQVWESGEPKNIWCLEKKIPTTQFHCVVENSSHSLHDLSVSENEK
jgi:hypothetical protein